MSTRTIFEQRKSQKGSIALSIVVHAVAIALIASITFRYPIAALFESPTRVPVEHITYVRTQPRAAQAAAAGTPTAEKRPARKPVAPAPIIAPTTIPTTLPPVTPPQPTPGVVGGTGTGTGTAAVGVATGVEPTMPDPRIELHPNTLRLPLTAAERNDSAVKAIYVAYREAEIASEENRGRSPRDWTFEKGGQKYGLDSQYVYLGKFKLPSAILAALPFNFGGVDGARIIQARNANWIRDDIYSHAQGLSEEDFREAVRRIRERKDREHREAEEAKEKPKAAQPPIVP
ncbi:MAG TPA: hypothetical protein VHB25_08820 [Gemmatimonadaceae bacterium]|nr:hypothetical protein [Gemmatimonadaceae bacterium]